MDDSEICRYICLDLHGIMHIDWRNMPTILVICITIYQQGQLLFELPIPSSFCVFNLLVHIQLCCLACSQREICIIERTMTTICTGQSEPDCRSQQRLCIYMQSRPRWQARSSKTRVGECHGLRLISEIA